MNVEARLRVRLRANRCTILEARAIIRVVQSYFLKYKTGEFSITGLGVFKRTTMSWKDSYFLVPESSIERFIVGQSEFKNHADESLIEFLLENGLSDELAKITDRETKLVFAESLKEDGKAVVRSVLTIVRTTKKAYAVYPPQ